MDTYNVLVVDDEPPVTQVISAHFKKRKDIVIHVANTVEEAMHAVQNNFFHMAFVDLQLNDGRADGGMGVFNRLRNARPSCKTYLLTAHPDAYRTELFVLLDPTNAQILGAVDKYDFSIAANGVIEHFAQLWLSSKRTILKIDDLSIRVIKRTSKSSTVMVTRDEIDFVLSSLLGQGVETLLGRRDADLLMTKIELDILEGGRSRSVVGAGRPADEQGNRGIWCVVKLGLRTEIEQEYVRYNAYVQYTVSASHRVEMLGHAFGDTLGCICYSFAGKAPEVVKSLFEMFMHCQDVSSHLKQMFALDSRDLYGRSGEERELANYFSETYKLAPLRIQKEIGEFVEKLRKSRLPIVDEILSKKVNVEITNQAFRNAIMRESLKTCIVHGDMNANNVIVAEDGRVIYIDHSHTGCGPRAVDFAALEASLRLATCPETVAEVITAATEEEEVWKGKWETRSRTASSYVSKISLALAGYARINFEGISETEYAATCLLWGARLFRVVQLSTQERLRILLWMMQCAAVINS